jgi:hypothetical protein
MATLEGGDIGLPRLAPGSRRSAGLIRTGVMVNVVAHQHIRLDTQFVLRGTVGQQVDVVTTAVVIEKDGALIAPRCVICGGIPGISRWA